MAWMGMDAVDSMEHGAVWVTYDPAIIEATAAAEAFAGRPYVLVTPAEGLSAPVVATAWSK